MDKRGQSGLTKGERKGGSIGAVMGIQGVDTHGSLDLDDSRSKRSKP